MRKVLVVAVREYKAAVVSKAFIITLVAMPVLWGGAAAAQIFLRNKVDTTDKRFAIIDRTGQLYETLAAAARARNENEIFKGSGNERKQVQPRFLLEQVDPATVGQAPQSTLQLSDRVRNKELLAFVDIGADVLDSAKSSATEKDAAANEAGPAKIAYYSNSPTYDDFQKWLTVVLNAQIHAIRFKQAGLDSDLVRRATRNETVEGLGLVSRDESGRITEAEKVNPLANIFVPMGLMTLMLLAVMVGASPMLQNVLEEKLGRIAEVLLGSIPPFQLMLGKLLGSVGVSLTIVSIYLTGGYFALRYAGYGDYFPGHLIAWFVLFQSLAVLMYGSMFSAVGASVSDMKEAQSALMPVMIIAMAPMFVWLNVVKEPTSTFATVLSLVPPATPMLMVLRQAVPPGIPAWQPILGVVLVILTTLGCVFAAGRVFRVGLLMQGKGADLRQMLRWVLRG